MEGIRLIGLLNVLLCETGKMMMPFTELGKLGEKKSLGKKSLLFLIGQIYNPVVILQ